MFQGCVPFDPNPGETREGNRVKLKQEVFRLPGVLAYVRIGACSLPPGRVLGPSHFVPCKDLRRLCSGIIMVALQSLALPLPTQPLSHPHPTFHLNYNLSRFVKGVDSAKFPSLECPCLGNLLLCDQAAAWGCL